MKGLPPKTIALGFRIFLALFFLAVGGGLFSALKNHGPVSPEAEDDRPPLRVMVMEARQVVLARQWAGYGTTQAKNPTDVPTRVGTTVVEIPDDIEVGRTVEAGQVLAILDATDFESEAATIAAQLEEIEAALAQIAIDASRLEERLALEREDARIARTEYERQVGYLDSGRATQQDVDRSHRLMLNANRAIIATEQSIDGIAPRRATLSAQRSGLSARLETAKLNVARCTITSPIDGIIDAFGLEQGENLTPGQTVARIIDPRTLEIPLQLAASAYSQVKVGNTVRITARNHPPECEPWTATITRIGGSNDPQMRTITVYAELDQSATPLAQFAAGGSIRNLPVGAFVLFTLTTDDREPRWVVPARAIRSDRIRLITDSEISSRPVTSAFNYEGALPQLGLPDTQWIVLSSELTEGEQIVVSASISVLDGQRVEAVPATHNGGVGDKSADPEDTGLSTLQTPSRGTP